MKIMKNQNPQRLSIMTLALLSSFAVHAAPVAPDAGQTNMMLQKDPALLVPKVIPSLHIEGGNSRKGEAAGTVRFAVKAIHVKGNTAFGSQALEALVANLAGGEHSLNELDEGAARITAYYRDHGYVLARAYLPAQDIVDGVVVIEVMEGLVGQKHINNQSRVSDKKVNAILGEVKDGEALQAKPVDRALLLLGDTPGIGGARATLQPGASVGTSDLVLDLTPSAPYAADVEADNYGNRYTGVNRLGAALALNSPAGIGDQLNMRVLASDLNMRYARLAYAIPMGSSWRAGVAYSDTTYKLGEEFASLQASGSATSSSVYAMYPFIRSQTSNLSGTLTFEDKHLIDLTGAPVSAADHRVLLSNFGLTGNHQDSFGGGGMSSMDLSLVSGKLSMDAVSQATDATTAMSNGTFARFNYNLNRLQHVTDKNTLSVALSGQQSDTNLGSSEKFALGGAYGVRAYPQGEGIGDEGWMTNLELRHSFRGNLEGVMFYDAGSVTINRNPYVTGDNTRFLSGTGVGANTTVKNFQFKAYAAWRESGGEPTSVPAGTVKNATYWVQAGMQF